MKKNLIIFSAALVSLSLTAFNLVQFNNLNLEKPVKPTCQKSVYYNLNADHYLKKEYVDFFYDLGTRFAPLKKGDLEKKVSISQFISEKRRKEIVSYKSVNIIVVENDKQTDVHEYGTSEIFTDSQLKLLRSAEYSSHLLFRTDYKEVNKETGELEDSHMTPYYTVVPEKQAEFVPGKEKFIEYLKTNNKENTANLNKDKLQPAKLYFTITKNGEIDNLRLDRTSGFTKIDKSMKDLLIKMPGKWIPAENSKGEKVDQELVLSFGMVGC